MINILIYDSIGVNMYRHSSLYDGSTYDISSLQSCDTDARSLNFDSVSRPAIWSMTLSTVAGRRQHPPSQASGLHRDCERKHLIRCVTGYQTVYFLSKCLLIQWSLLLHSLPYVFMCLFICLLIISHLYLTYDIFNLRRVRRNVTPS